MDVLKLSQRKSIRMILDHFTIQKDCFYLFLSSLYWNLASFSKDRCYFSIRFQIYCQLTLFNERKSNWDGDEHVSKT
jgi:hypothetical protein